MKLFKGILLVAVVGIGLLITVSIFATILSIAVPNYLTAREAHTFVDEGYSFSTAPQISHRKSNSTTIGLAELLIGFLSALIFAYICILAKKSRRNAAQSLTINENDAIRELMRVQDRMEQRITNLETILLSRTHTGVPKD
ncbi:MAG: hypothetical protein ABFD69_00915 [Candidatus Sumerlaeia bacterium]